MASGLRIGIDFDNTIVSYDQVFCTTAKSCGLIDPGFFGRKQAVRDAIRLLPDGEISWQRLQGHVYGKGIAEAKMIAGVEGFLLRCRAERSFVAIVSHKTEYGHYDVDRVNLREAALGWMAARGLFRDDCAGPVADVFFEDTRAEKLRRITALSLTHFIDDLEEVLTDPAFPPHTKRILFAHEGEAAGVPYPVCRSWREIEEQVFDRA
jgi:hypothetical protein